MEVKAKQADVPSLPFVPYTANIGRTMLKNHIYIGKLDDVNPEVKIDSITDDVLER